MSTPYHENINKAVFDLIPKSALKIVDVGCMNGILAREFKKISPNSNWIGIEINSEYAERARHHMDTVIVGNIENEDFEFLDEIKDADCFVFADVLEHLYNPWGVIKKIRNMMKETAVVVACVPNAQNYSVIGRLLSGEFFYEDIGLMDRTHIRWFTRRTFFDLFEQHGYSINEGLFVTDSLPDQTFLGCLKTSAEIYSKKQVHDVDFTATQFAVRAIPIG